MIFKWEQLKLKACRELSTQFHLENQGIYAILQSMEQQIIGDKRLSWGENAVEMKEKAWKMIEKWDIRKAKKLFEAFPNIIPAKYHKQTPICDMDDKGNWCIYFS